MPRLSIRKRHAAEIAAMRKRDWAGEFKVFRERFHFSQREMAGLMECHVKTIFNIENRISAVPKGEVRRKFHALCYRLESERRLELAEATRQRHLVRSLRSSEPNHLVAERIGA
jgi:DNA-binding XRE family transcriptional regulator